LGYDESALLGRNVSLLMPSETAVQHDHYLQRYIATGEAHIIGTNRQVQAQHRDGHAVSILLSIADLVIDGKHWFVGLLRAPLDA
jgi:PAS domain S-box-containing protein